MKNYNVLMKIDDYPFQELPTPNFKCFQYKNTIGKYPTIRFQYKITEKSVIFYVFLNYVGKNSDCVKNIYLCDQYNDETKSWIGEIKINPNTHKMFNMLGNECLFISFMFHLPSQFNPFNLKSLSILAISNKLQDLENSKHLPIPNIKKKSFCDDFLEILKIKNPLYYWLHYGNQMLFYVGLPGTKKRQDIHMLTLNQSVGQWKSFSERMFSREFDFFAKANQFVIIYIPIVHSFYFHWEFKPWLDGIKNRHISSSWYSKFNNTKFIFISEYPPEVLCDRFDCQEYKEWFLENIFKVKKDTSFLKNKLININKCCFCQTNIYFGEEKCTQKSAHIACYEAHTHYTVKD